MATGRLSPSIFLEEAQQRDRCTHVYNSLKKLADFVKRGQDAQRAVDEEVSKSLLGKPAPAPACSEDSAMTIKTGYREENGHVVLTLTRDDYNRLSLALGYAAGWMITRAARREVFGLGNRINEGNPHFTPAVLSADAD